MWSKNKRDCDDALVYKYNTQILINLFMFY